MQSLAHGRYTFRYDQVLSTLKSHLKEFHANCRKVASRSSKVHFVQEGDVVR